MLSYKRGGVGGGGDHSSCRKVPKRMAAGIHGSPDCSGNAADSLFPNGAEAYFLERLNPEGGGREAAL